MGSSLLYEKTSGNQRLGCFLFLLASCVILQLRFLAATYSARTGYALSGTPERNEGVSAKVAPLLAPTIGSREYFEKLCGLSVEFPPSCSFSQTPTPVAIEQLLEKLDCSLQENRRRDLGQKPSVNFFAFASGSQYLAMSVLYAFFALSKTSKSVVEIVVKKTDITPFLDAHASELAWILQHFGGDSLCLRAMSPLTPNRTGISNTWRFLEVPVRKANYTYIGDVDILFTESVLDPKRFQQMRHFNLPYSNVIRENTKRLTGVILMETEKFYTADLIQNQNNISAWGKNDEAVLYELCQLSGIGLPDVFNKSQPHTTYRPTHGLHLSFNRGPNKTMCHSSFARYAKIWCEVMSTENLQSLLCLHGHVMGAGQVFTTFISEAITQEKADMSAMKDENGKMVCQAKSDP